MAMCQIINRPHRTATVAIFSIVSCIICKTWKREKDRVAGFLRGVKCVRRFRLEHRDIAKPPRDRSLDPCQDAQSIATQAECNMECDSWLRAKPNTATISISGSKCGRGGGGTGGCGSTAIMPWPW
ncbi:hypothetical protein BDBG_01813 [Blastomyces gilchristii SLH14081]|uniref:Uncharacterized protein n=2 Tax=Blastomyces TaxID=229219 RepID=A0A179UBT6_BLAGS|nr:uncharacterized protein BDBG_01813 [Blastomyces gilchristii SLH14081]EGE77204.2 hypothetical protein BDDG_00141 [Blastomyces dermatitidis ATCC 18188]OAT05414.1 hypothetical protein BDBG_01813 [Blastomyces gilchristii SLH14081]